LWKRQESRGPEVIRQPKCCEVICGARLKRCHGLVLCGKPVCATNHERVAEDKKSEEYKDEIGKRESSEDVDPFGRAHESEAPRSGRSARSVDSLASGRRSPVIQDGSPSA